MTVVSLVTVPLIRVGKETIGGLLRLLLPQVKKGSHSDLCIIYGPLTVRAWSLGGR